MLVVPIVVVIALLKYAQGKQKKKSRAKVAAYLHKVTEQAEIIPSYQKRLVHQLVIVDEQNRKLLVIGHRNATLSHDVFSLDETNSIKVFNHKKTLMASENDRKPETFTTQIGVELTIEKTGTQQFLTLYDHVEHSIYNMAELEKEAWQLKERIARAKNGEPVKA